MDRRKAALLGWATALQYADDPVARLVSGPALIFSATIPVCMTSDEIEAFKVGVHHVFPGCQFLLGTEPCRCPKHG